MTDLQSLTAAVASFRDERDWAQFHTPKDCHGCAVAYTRTDCRANASPDT